MLVSGYLEIQPIPVCVSIEHQEGNSINQLLFLMTTNDVDSLLNRIVEDMKYADVIIDSLHSMGYCNNYKLAGNKLVCLQTQLFYFPRDFKVDEIYSFDVKPMQIEGYYLYALRDSTGQPAGIFTAYPVQG